MASRPKEIATGVYRLSSRGANVYFVRSGASWVLIDAAWSTSARQIRRAAESLFGRDARPAVILVTHMHPDHAGAAGELARMWGVPVYAHPADLSLESGGLSLEYANALYQWVSEPLLRIAQSRPVAGILARSNIADVARALDPDVPPPGLADWVCVHTPGHTPGHVAFFRRSDGVLIAGDACLTVNVRSTWDLLRDKQTVAAPLRSTTWYWQAEKESVSALARLEPRVLASGHGVPMTGPDIAQELHAFATRFSGGDAAVQRMSGSSVAPAGASRAALRGSSLRSALIRRTVGFVVWQYRLTRGRSARLFGAPGEALLLTTRGRKSGTQRTVPLQGFRDSDGLVVVAANNGQAINPSWYYNLKATPWAQVELMGRTLRVRAEELSAEEAAAFWRRLAQIAPAYAQTQQRTARTMPLLRLIPVALAVERPAPGATAPQVERAGV